MQNTSIFDLSEFPIVKGRSSGLSEGYSALWIEEMEHLLAGGRPFVLLYTEQQGHEGHSDQKARGIWLKANRARLSELCRGVISVEVDPILRAKRQSQGAALGSAFGTSMLVVEDPDEAASIAIELLGVPE